MLHRKALSFCALDHHRAQPHVLDGAGPNSASAESSVLAWVAMKPSRPEPLVGHHKYEKVRCSRSGVHGSSSLPLRASSPPALPREAGARPQIKDLNSGTFGFVQLCKDKTTGELTAIKFIERGEKVQPHQGPFQQCRGPEPSSSSTYGSACSSMLELALQRGPIARGGRAQVHRAQRAPRSERVRARAQVTKYVEREILNHRSLMHPHIVQFKEVRAAEGAAGRGRGSLARRSSGGA